MRTADFFQSSKSIVKGFLSSVIAIDDQLCFDSQQINFTPDDDPFKPVAIDDSGLGHSEAIAVTSPTESSNLNPQLNYQDLSLAFASYGINCCAFRPDQSRFENIEAAAMQITKSAQRTDITILDWSMDGQFGQQPGTLARSSIQKILEEDKSQLGRLRLIVIYTAENSEDIAQHALEVAKLVDANAVLDKKNVKFKDSHLEFCQISVIEKSTNIEDLCNEVIDLFTEQTAGLLSNAALAAVGELRNKTHHILHSFNKHLDPAYLSHVMCLKASKEARENAHEVAFDYATDIISEEFKSSLQISQTLKEHLSLDRLKKWVELAGSQQNNVFDFTINDNSYDISSDRFNKLLEVTNQDELDVILAGPPAIKVKNFKKIQINLAGDDHFPHENLSALECKRRDLLSLKSSEHLPNIKQGSILKDDAYYYLCVQPLCDTVRIFEDSNFLFLKIDKVEDDKFSHVLKDADGNFLRLKISPGSKSLQIFRFPPDPISRTIKCKKMGDELKVSYVQFDGYECNLTWIAELKGNVAQSIVNELASKISRVGLDTNEWLRSR